MESVVVPAPQVEKRPEPIVQPKPVVPPVVPAVNQPTNNGDGDNHNLNQLFNRASDNVRNEPHRTSTKSSR